MVNLFMKYPEKFEFYLSIAVYMKPSFCYSVCTSPANKACAIYWYTVRN